MEDRIEALEQARHRMLTGFLIAFVAWQVPTIVQDTLTERAAPLLFRACAVLAAVAAVAWIAYALRLWRLQRQVAEEPMAARVLDDERVREARLRALGFGFWALVVYLTMARLGAFLVDLPTDVVAQAGLLVGVASAIGAFLVYDRG